MPNNLAYLALFAWPLVSLVLFQRMPPLRAMIWTILGGYMFLPPRVGINLPMVPTLDKSLIPTLSAAALFAIFAGRQAARDRQATARAQRRGLAATAETAAEDSTEKATEAPSNVQGRPAGGRAPRSGRRASRTKTGGGGRTLVWYLSRLAVLMILILPFGVYYTNQEPISMAIRTLPGVKLYDAFSMALNNAVMILPFLLGLRYLRDVAGHRELLRAFSWGGLLYAPLVLFEVRMSPQLNVWIYGFFASNFAQHVRGGHFRPIVFLEHGLRVGIFLTMACLAAAVMYRISQRPGWLWATLGLIVVQFLSRNLGAFLILLMLLPVILFAGRRLQIIITVALAGTILLYPMIRGAGWVPTEQLTSIAADINPARAQSLKVRLDNEDRLLAKANQKRLFGWGGWGRSRVFDEDGRDISVTDGIWVIIMGVDGWLGYLAKFGLLTVPLLALARYGRGQEATTLGLAVVLVANLIDMIPNSSLTPLSWLIAGAMTGRMQYQLLPALQNDTGRSRVRQGSRRGLVSEKAGVS